MYVDGDSPLDQLVSATEAARDLGLSVSTITAWATRGYLDGDEKRKLKPAGLSERDRPLYRLRDIMLAERATRRRAGRTYATAA